MPVKQITTPRGPPPTQQILESPIERARRSICFENSFLAIINNSRKYPTKTKWQSLFRNAVLYPDNAIFNKDDEDDNGTVPNAPKVFYNIYRKKIIFVLDRLIFNYN